MEKEKKSASVLRKAYIEDSIRSLRKQEMSALDDADRKRKGKLSKGQRNAAIAGAVIAAYGAYVLVDSGAASQISKNISNSIRGTEHKWTKNSALAAKDMDVDQLFGTVVSRINPDYGSPGTTNNCRRCTFAYEMSRRGYDVSATKTLTATGQNLVGETNALGGNIKGGRIGGALKVAIEKRANAKTGAQMSEFTKNAVFANGIGENPIWKKTGIGDSLTSGDIFSRLAEQPNGSRGEFNMRWLNGGGHSMAYEIVNGKPVIFDTQSQKIFKDIVDLDVYTSRAKDAGFTRLDNKDLNSDFLQRWLKNNS